MLARTLSLVTALALLAISGGHFPVLHASHRSAVGAALSAQSELAASEPALARFVRSFRILALHGPRRPVHLLGRPIDTGVEGITLPGTHRLPGSFLVHVRGDARKATATGLGA